MIILSDFDVILIVFTAAALIWLLLTIFFRYKRLKHRDLLTTDGETLEGLPWQVYPRPQLVRDSYLNLNGQWDFARSFSRQIPASFPQQIRVPFPPESILSGIKKIPHKYEYLYYRRSLVIPDGFIKDKVLLHFGAVDQIATVFLNGKKLATHIGGFLPFTVELPGDLQTENTIILRVRDTLSHSLPYGKQRRKRGGMWYTPVSGIWQTVWLESVPAEYIRALKITPDLDSVCIEVDSDAKNLLIEITTPNGMFERTFTGNQITLTIDSPIHWSPENPHLYPFRIKTENDDVTSYFALRTMTISKSAGLPRLFLNGKPYFFHGVLDQGYYSDGIYLPASIEGYRKDIAMMKELGFNTLRKHVKVEPANYYHLCDTMGMVVFQDMPNIGHYSYLRDTVLPTLGFVRHSDKRIIRLHSVRNNYISHAHQTIAHLFNYPSICLWTLFNEGWGQFDSAKHYEWVKKMDQTRFVNSSSGWIYQRASDVDSLHIYFVPIKVKSGKRPVILSEFGGYSLKLPDHAYNKNKAFGYRFYTNKAGLQDAIEKVYSEEVSEQIQNGLCASIFTQVSDVEDETNGFQTYDRKVLKVDKTVMQKIAAKLKHEIDCR